jgi:tetratricopeptide (TPR) repeat protein
MRALLVHLWLVLLLSFACGLARADDLIDARKLLRGGDRSGALQLVDKMLTAKPSDQQARFLKGVILAEDGRVTEAMGIYAKLTQDYPELPEAHNNLAVLYAARGELERAREELALAIRTNPGFATAHENLGDVYAQLAAQAYDKAAQLDARNAQARAKLALARDITKPAQKKR